MAKKIELLCTAFRDGFQSVYGSRVLPKDYMPVVKMAKDAGIRRFESGGGAAFQSAFFYLNENAFDVMDLFRKTVGEDAYLQTLARGINVVGLDSQSSDIIKLHAQLFKKHGVTAIRNFDALNDPDNLLYSGQCIVDAGLQHQISVAMMSLPPGSSGAHDAEFYEQTLRKIIESGVPFHSVAFKDASGTAFPSLVFETIKRARNILGENVPIEFHSHETAGTGLACYLSAIEAGADIVDLSMAPVSGGTCQPDIASLWHALRGSKYELNVDIDAVMKVEEAFKDTLKDYFLPPEALHVEPQIPWSPMPGGALTSNTQMLRDNGIMDKYAEIIKAMEEVVRKGGYGTSVTPVSQFYFQQAFNNVMNGPWQKIAEGYGKMVLGYFGKTPVPPDKEVIEIASEQLGLEPTTQSPRLINDANPKKGVEAAKKVLAENNLLQSDENIFIAATCGDKGISFLKGEGKVTVRYNEKTKPKKDNYKIIVDGQTFNVRLSDKKVIVGGESFSFSVGDISQENKPVQPVVSSGSVKEIKSPIVGTITAVLVQSGQVVQKGMPLFTIEVMKMETQIKASENMTVAEVLVAKGTQVTQGQVLARSV
ncbi:MAG: biotin/lipoyl-binding protein [Alphaproteobacteria bacterium]|nr:biotin/lipoyl-binding protein [Alphaproteobacteria bacterium]